ncbi:MAG: FAD-binding protein [Actinomycetota bacterium]|nr:MAG: FAD-binding protein [Actinomycetota bacterium]
MTADGFDVDLLVVGAGMAGMTAAAYAAGHGASVLVVEKAAEIGGSALLSGGGLLRPQSAADLMAINPSGDPKFATMLSEDYDGAIEWIASTGVAVTDVDTSIPAVMGYPSALRGFDIGAYIPRCRAIVESAGGHVVPLTDVEELLVADGRVVGARLRDRDGVSDVRARWTLLATGGFHNNPELRARYLGGNAKTMLVRGNQVSDGAGLRLALSVGGTTTPLMNRFYGHTVPWPLDHEFVKADYVRLAQHYLSTHSVILDKSGHRIVDESLGYYRNSQAVLANDDGRALLVGDQRVREADMAGGAPERTLGYERLDRITEAAKAGGHAIEAPTVEELDELVRPWGYHGVAAAVAAFNSQLQSGTELDPPRSRNRDAIDRGPFFAIEIQPAITNTWGGLQVNERMQVVRSDGEPVPGLLATGADLGGAFHEKYCSGLNLACTSGLRAAKLALDGLRQE